MSREYSVADIIITFMIFLIGAAEAAHLFGIFFHRSLSECVPLLCGLWLLMLVGAVLLTIYFGRKKQLFRRAGEAAGRGEKLLLMCFVLLVLAQLVCAAVGNEVCRDGDMTVETVGSFLQSNAIYEVNPLTGRAYEGGIPGRLRILCLPTIYAVLCSVFSVSPGFLVWRVIPVITLLGCYGAYVCLSKSLFPESRCRQCIFLIVTALVIFAEGYALGMDGFHLLFSGWRGVAIRNAVLVPYTFSLCLRKKYLHALLCVAAEACIVWTLYGMGVCAVVIAGMFLFDILVKRMGQREEAAE